MSENGFQESQEAQGTGSSNAGSFARPVDGDGGGLTSDRFEGDAAPDSPPAPQAPGGAKPRPEQVSPLMAHWVEDDVAFAPGSRGRGLDSRGQKANPREKAGAHRGGQNHGEHGGENHCEYDGQPHGEYDKQGEQGKSAAELGGGLAKKGERAHDAAEAGDSHVKSDTDVKGDKEGGVGAKGGDHGDQRGGNGAESGERDDNKGDAEAQGKERSNEKGGADARGEGNGHESGIEVKGGDGHKGGGPRGDGAKGGADGAHGAPGGAHEGSPGGEHDHGTQHGAGADGEHAHVGGHGSDAGGEHTHGGAHGDDAGGGEHTHGDAHGGSHAHAEGGGAAHTVGDGGHGGSAAPDGTEQHDAAGTPMVLDAIAQAAGAAKQSYSAGVSAAVAKIPGAVAEQQGVIAAAAASATAAVSAAVSSARARVGASIAAALGRIAGAGGRERAALGTWQGQAAARASKMFQQGTQDMHQATQQTADRGQQVASQAAQSAQRQIMQAAQQGKATGSSMAGVGSSIPEAAVKKAEAAQSLGQDAYDKISESAAPTAEKIRSSAPDFASRVRQGGQEAAQKIQGMQPQLLQQIAQLVQGGGQGITQAVARASSALNQMRAAVSGQLAQLQAAAHKKIADAKAQQSAGIAQAGKDLQQGLNHQKASMLQAADQSVAEAKQQVQGKAISKATAPRVIAQVVPRLQRGLQPGVAAVDKSVAGGIAGLGKAGAAGAAAVRGIGSRSAAGIHSAATQASTAAAQQAAAGERQVAQAREKTVGAGNDLLGKAQEAVSKAVTTLKTKLGDQLKAFASGVQKTASNAVSKARQQLGDLPGRIRGAQSKIENKYQEEKRKSENRSFLGKIADAVTSFLSAAWNWIKDNWKAIVTVIAIVVVTVLIAAAAAALAPLLAGVLVASLGMSALTATIVSGVIIGLAAGIVGRTANQIVTNVAAGKSPLAIDWGKVFDPKAMLLDAVTGGVGAGVGQALQGAKMTTQVLANAGVGLGGGVLGNVINGKPPFSDVKGLLVSTVAGGLGPVVGARTQNLSLANKAILQAGIGSGTAIVNNLVHGESAFHDVGNIVGSGVTGAVSTAGQEGFGTSSAMKRAHAAAARPGAGNTSAAPAAHDSTSSAPRPTEAVPASAVHEATPSAPRPTEAAAVPVAHEAKPSALRIPEATVAAVAHDSTPNAPKPMELATAPAASKPTEATGSSATSAEPTASSPKNTDGSTAPIPATTDPTAITSKATEISAPTPVSEPATATPAAEPGSAHPTQSNEIPTQAGGIKDMWKRLFSAKGQAAEGTSATSASDKETAAPTPAPKEAEAATTKPQPDAAQPAAARPEEVGYRQAQNGGDIIERASAAVEKMPPAEMAAYEQIYGAAENPAQQVMLERAVAAGRSVEEVRALAGQMRGKTEAQLLKEFTGHGMYQHFMESCVPASFQIARAELDPVYAAQMRADPVAMAREQSAALQATGGRRAQRGQRGDNAFDNSPAISETRQANPALEGFYQDPTNFSMQGSSGIEPSLMPGTSPHSGLESAAGQRYGVHTRDDLHFQNPGAGQFSPDQLPHASIQAAVERGLPVPVSSSILGMGHEQVIIGMSQHNGELHYHMHDPMSGRVTKLPASFFDLSPNLGFTTVALPESRTPSVSSRDLSAPDGTNTGPTKTGSSIPPEPEHRIENSPARSDTEPVSLGPKAVAEDASTQTQNEGGTKPESSSEQTSSGGKTGTDTHAEAAHHTGEAWRQAKTPTELADTIGQDFKASPLRQEYEGRVRALAAESEQMILAAHGDSQKLEAAARYIAEKRINLSAEYKHMTPEPLRDYIFEVNRSRYDTEWGPSFDFLMKKYNGDFETIIRKAATPNANVDKLLGGFRGWILKNGSRYTADTPQSADTPEKSVPSEKGA